MENVAEEFIDSLLDQLVYRLQQQTQVWNAERLALSGGSENRGTFEK